MIRVNDLNRLNFGSHFLGSGGGEESLNTKMMVEGRTNCQPIPLVSLQKIQSDALVLVVSFLGCPTIEDEKMSNVLHLQRLIAKTEETCRQSISIIATLGVGGGTVFFPLFIADYFHLPILDADCFGRCFPELQMMSTNMADIQPRKAFITNLMGDVLEIGCDNFNALERHARRIAVSSGGGCTIVPQVLTGEEAKRGLIPGTLTKAMTIGQIIQDTRHLDCEAACSAIVDYTKGTFWGIGGIMSIDGYLSNLPRPFNRRIVMKNLKEGKTWEVLMANEYDLLLENGKIVGEVPDIITLCDMHTREPLTIRGLHENRNIAIFTTPAPALWYTEKGLALVRTKEHERGRNALCGLGGLNEQTSALEKIA